MQLDLVQYLLGAVSGGLVGLTLGLFGGGGSILAVPLMVYFVGVADPHIAIGTSAVAVAANAAVNLATHVRQGNVRWRCALTYIVRIEVVDSSSTPLNFDLLRMRVIPIDAAAGAF